MMGSGAQCGVVNPALRWMSRHNATEIVVQSSASSSDPFDRVISGLNTSAQAEFDRECQSLFQRHDSSGCCSVEVCVCSSTLLSELAMSTIPYTGTVTFTLKSVPQTPSGFRTMERLMRLEKSAQRILKKLQEKRIKHLNRRTERAGRIWLARARCTRLVCVEAGRSFTIQVTPQLSKDIASVAKHLDFTVAA